MAKLKAPLFSLGASGALGKALVFFGWKGLDVVREYVVPTNPKTSGQTTQRGYLSDAVEAIHDAQTAAADPMTSVDTSAYALWGSIFATPRTWFNQAVKNWIDQEVDSLRGAIYRGGSCSPAVDSLDVVVRSDLILAEAINAGRFYYGTSKTALISSVIAVPNIGNNQMGANIPGLTTGTKYFVQFRPTAVADWVGAYSGIYYGTPT